MPNMADRKEFSKSAPANGRRQSNTEQKKNSTITEINTWITKGSNDQFKRSVARHVSQLTENVTEERMLYARQLELGRERYKFLVSHEYEKQKFVERQTVKEKRMKTFMSSARRVIEKAHSDKPKKITVHIPQVDYSSMSSTPVNEEQTERLESRASKASSKSVKQNDSTTRLKSLTGSKGQAKGDSSCKDTRQRCSRQPVTTAKKGPKEITFVDYSRPDSRALRDAKESGKLQAGKQERKNMAGNSFYMNTSLNPSGEPSGSVTKENDSTLPAVTTACIQRTNNQDRNTPVLPPRSSTMMAATGVGRNNHDIKAPCSRLEQVTALVTTSVSEPVTPKWYKKREIKFGEKFGSSITDPRYVALHNTLTPLDLPTEPKMNVKDIIANNYVLRTSSKCESAAHAKLMHAKFIALLLEKELAVE